MTSFNQVTLIGNLGADPDIRSMQNGNQVCNLSIATSERWKDKNTGEPKERTEWHRVTVWPEGLIRVIEQYLKKGDQVMIVGRLETRKWQDQDGKDRYSTEVVLRPYKSDLQIIRCKAWDKSDRGGEDGQDGETNSFAKADDYGRGTPQQPSSRSAAMNDEIPF